ncbi:MAG TPA: hypothetical protein VF041_14695 [Gemmatimonadaceae bacterium]
MIPLFACEILREDVIRKLPGFAKRTSWFLANRPDLAKHISCMARMGESDDPQRLLAVPSRERLVRVLRHVPSERELLSPYGIRSISREYADAPYVFRAGDAEYRVDYAPAEGNTGLVGGNSNWRGPIWFPINYLLIESLERYHRFYGDSLRVECPTGSGHLMTLEGVARELSRRLASIFLPGARGRRPLHGAESRYAEDPHWRELVLFYEYFHGDTGRGVGASHQTGWTALAVRCIEDLVRERRTRGAVAPSLSEPERAPAHA